MPIYKVTYCEPYKRANLFHHGCNFRCRWCSYKLDPDDAPRSFLDVEEIERALAPLDVERMHFLGGEPTLNPQLPSLVRMAKERGIITKIGHSNGWNSPPEGIDEMNMSIKMLDDEKHRVYCGVSNRRILRNLRAGHASGVKMDVSSVLIPELVPPEEIGRIAEFVASVDPAIPFHIIGYIPVPGVPWRRPSLEELVEAVELSREHLSKVTFSAWNGEDFRRPHLRDERYRSVRVA